MCGAIDVQQAGTVDLDVQLGGGQAGVAKQFLDLAQVRPGTKQVCCKRMAKGMWRCRFRQPEAIAQFLHCELDNPRAERAAFGAQEQR